MFGPPSLFPVSLAATGPGIGTLTGNTGPRNFLGTDTTSWANDTDRFAIMAISTGGAGNGAATVNLGGVIDNNSGGHTANFCYFDLPAAPGSSSITYTLPGFFTASPGYRVEIDNATYKTFDQSTNASGSSVGPSLTLPSAGVVFSILSDPAGNAGLTVSAGWDLIGESTDGAPARTVAIAYKEVAGGGASGNCTWSVPGNIIMASFT